jgi:acetyl-CoA synthetase
MSENYLNINTYKSLYKESIENSDQFWSKQALQFITWTKPWDMVSDCDFATGKVHWYSGAQLNACYNCLDRHLPNKANVPAIIWEGNDPNDATTLTYQDLYLQVCKFANVLLGLGVKPGDKVSIYLPMIPELVIAMLACTRIGAVHSIVFGGFSAEALRARILDCGATVVVTANEGLRGEKIIPLKESVEEAIADLDQVTDVIVVKRTITVTPWDAKRDRDYAALMANASTECPCYNANSLDPLFILYTSGSTGKPKGALHSTAGYLTYAAMTFHYVFDYRPGEIYWCTADAGWITGHTYVVYGPLLNGATILMYEGVPTYPTASRMWEIIDKYKVNTFYTSPTLIRSLMSMGDEYLKNSSRNSLRILGSVGEPINPAAWEWFYHKIGNSKCPIVDTWWQTETGGILISALPGATKLLPGSATKPLFGIEPLILDEQGHPIEGEGEGALVIAKSWPGQMQTIFGDHERYIDNYFSRFPGYYFSGDGARRDADGNFWVTGRMDDVLKVSGHRIGTAEVESSIVRNPAVAEAAVVGIPDEIKGEAIYAYVQLKNGISASKELEKDLIAEVKKDIGSFAAPQSIHFCKELPKTRSGKIMRRILRKIAVGETEEFGDISTLSNTESVANLIAERDAS